MDLAPVVQRILCVTSFSVFLPGSPLPQNPIYQNNFGTHNYHNNVPTEDQIFEKNLASNYLGCLIRGQDGFLILRSAAFITGYHHHTNF